MKTKTIELNPSQVKVTYLNKKGEPATDVCYRHLFEVELIGCDVIPSMVVRVKFPELDYGASEDAGKEAKVKVTYLEPNPKEIKYMGKLKNWISPK
jgi:hypothetical protein